MIRQRIAPPLALACLLLAGCGGSSLGAASTPTITRAALPTITLGPSPTAVDTATATLPPAISQHCVQSLSGASGVVHNGDFLITFRFGLNYPARQLPDGLPLKPYQFTTQPPVDPAVNPDVSEPGSGFNIDICNASAGAAHTIQSLAITIQRFTPNTGQLNAWHPCSPVYTRQNGPQGGGCGGGSALLNCVLAAFQPGASTGDSAAVGPDATASSCPTLPPPLALASDSDYYAELGVTMPTAAGTYTLALTVTADGTAPITIPFADPILLAPVAHDWDGQACTTPAMQSQIPTANPTTPYICPKS